MLCLGMPRASSFTRRCLVSHDASDLGALDQAVEQDDERALVFIAELVDLLIEAMQFKVVDFAFGLKLIAPEKFIRTDVEGIGDLDQGIGVRHGFAGFPAAVHAQADTEDLGHAALGELALGAQLPESFCEHCHVQRPEERGLVAHGRAVIH